MKQFNRDIVLIGMPGCGKTTIGAMIAARLGRQFIDIDKYIEAKEKRSIFEIFRENGEDYFRRVETAAVWELCRRNSVVIATGGGVVTRSENMDIMRQNGIIIYLERPLDLILASIELSARPLLAGQSQRIYTLYAERKHLYESYCHFRVVNDQSPAAATEKIVPIVKGGVMDEHPGYQRAKP